MARVTVEDCVLKIPNRFDLVIVAAQRARGIAAGASLTVERDNDKNPVVALREIAESTVDIAELEENVVKGLQKVVEIDEPEPEDEMEMLTAGGIAEAVSEDLGQIVEEGEEGIEGSEVEPREVEAGEEGLGEGSLGEEGLGEEESADEESGEEGAGAVELEIGEEGDVDQPPEE